MAFGKFSGLNDVGVLSLFFFFFFFSIDFGWVRIYMGSFFFFFFILLFYFLFIFSFNWVWLGFSFSTPPSLSFFPFLLRLGWATSPPFFSLFLFFFPFLFSSLLFFDLCWAYPFLSTTIILTHHQSTLHLIGYVI